MKSKKKLGIIIYARMNSRRLPNKVLKKIFDKTLLEIVYLRVKKKSFAIPIIVNTSKSKSDVLSSDADSNAAPVSIR